MIDRPTKYPDWALTDTVLGGEPNKIDPPSGKVQVGWSPGDIVPNNWLNSLQNSYGIWTRYLDSKVNPVLILNQSKPRASSVTAGTQIYISDLGAGGCIAFSDGTNWRKVSDNTII